MNDAEEEILKHSLVGIADALTRITDVLRDLNDRLAAIEQAREPWKVPQPLTEQYLRDEEWGAWIIDGLPVLMGQGIGLFHLEDIRTLAEGAGR